MAQIHPGFDEWSREFRAELDSLSELFTHCIEQGIYIPTRYLDRLVRVENRLRDVHRAIKTYTEDAAT